MKICLRKLYILPINCFLKHVTCLIKNWYFYTEISVIIGRVESIRNVLDSPRHNNLAPFNNFA